MKLSELLEALKPHPDYLGVQVSFEDQWGDIKYRTVEDIKIKNTNDGRKVVIVAK